METDKTMFAATTAGYLPRPAAPLSLIDQGRGLPAGVGGSRRRACIALTEPDSPPQVLPV